LVAVGHLELVDRPAALPGGAGISTLAAVSVVGTVLQLAWKGWTSLRTSKKANYYELISNPNLNTELDLSLNGLALDQGELKAVCEALGHLRNMRLRTLDLSGVVGKTADAKQFAIELAKALPALTQLQTL
jgi:hypothetical protein